MMASYIPLPDPGASVLLPASPWCHVDTPAATSRCYSLPSVANLQAMVASVYENVLFLCPKFSNSAYTTGIDVGYIQYYNGITTAG